MYANTLLRLLTKINSTQQQTNFNLSFTKNYIIRNTSAHIVL